VSFVLTTTSVEAFLRPIGRNKASDVGQMGRIEQSTTSVVAREQLTPLKISGSSLQARFWSRNSGLNPTARGSASFGRARRISSYQRAATASWARFTLNCARRAGANLETYAGPQYGEFKHAGSYSGAMRWLADPWFSSREVYRQMVEVPLVHSPPALTGRGTRGRGALSLMLFSSSHLRLAPPIDGTKYILSTQPFFFECVRSGNLVKRNQSCV
jgi:hypothetical protein